MWRQQSCPPEGQQRRRWRPQPESVWVQQRRRRRRMPLKRSRRSLPCVRTSHDDKWRGGRPDTEQRAEKFTNAQVTHAVRREYLDGRAAHACERTLARKLCTRARDVPWPARVRTRPDSWRATSEPEESRQREQMRSDVSRPSVCVCVLKKEWLPLSSIALDREVASTSPGEGGPTPADQRRGHWIVRDKVPEERPHARPPEAVARGHHPAAADFHLAHRLVAPTMTTRNKDSLVCPSAESKAERMSESRDTRGRQHAEEQHRRHRPCSSRLAERRQTGEEGAKKSPKARQVTRATTRDLNGLRTR